MSPESDMLFAHTDFGTLTEFDGFSKDMFLNNVIDTVAKQSIIEELDCHEDGMKPPLFNTEQLNDAFGVSMGGADGGGMMDSMSSSPFTMLLTEEPSEQLELIAVELSKMETLPGSDDLDTHGIMGLTSSLPMEESPDNKKDCMSLDELDLIQLNSSNALTESDPLLGLSSPPMEKGFVRRETRSLSSIDSKNPTLLQVSSPLSSPSSTTLSSLEDGSLFSMLYRHGDKLSIHGGVKEPLTRPMRSLDGMTESFCPSDNSSPSPRVDILASFRGASLGTPHIIQEQASTNPSLQRSQSSHNLGQLWLPTCLGSDMSESTTPPMGEQKIIFASADASQFTPYQASISRGIMGRSSLMPIRRVSSTGDLQAFNIYGGSLENAIREESVEVKIGHYTMEERKMKLHRYRQKRTERNFNKKIKYACRKTLADSRPRVRGRFARFDEIGDMAMKMGDLPLIDEYEEVTSYCCPRVIPEAAYSVPKGSCIMSNNGIPQFWNVVGMKVAM